MFSTAASCRRTADPCPLPFPGRGSARGGRRHLAFHRLELTGQLEDVYLRSYPGIQLVLVDGLGQELADAVLHALQPRIQVRSRGEQDDRKTARRVERP